MILLQAFFNAVDDHLRRYTGNDKSGQADKRSDEMEFFQYLVDTGGKKHNYEVDENSQKK